MTSQAYNLVWIPREFTRSQAGSEAIPPETVQNIIEVASTNRDVDTRFWIDTKRLTKDEMAKLDRQFESSTSNLSLHDLRTIKIYNESGLFDRPDLSPWWRIDRHSIIWRQVDAARILVCLEGSYDQTFYADADVTNLKINSPSVQNVLRKHGIIVSGYRTSGGSPEFENGLFGYTPSHRSIFEKLAELTQNDIRLRRNGYGTFVSIIREQLGDRVPSEEIVFTPSYLSDIAKNTPLLPEVEISQKTKAIAL